MGILLRCWRSVSRKTGEDGTMDSQVFHVCVSQSVSSSSLRGVRLQIAGCVAHLIPGLTLDESFAAVYSCTKPAECFFKRRCTLDPNGISSGVCIIHCNIWVDLPAIPMSSPVRVN